MDLDQTESTVPTIAIENKVDSPPPNSHLNLTVFPLYWDLHKNIQENKDFLTIGQSEPSLPSSSELKQNIKFSWEVQHMPCPRLVGLFRQNSGLYKLSFLTVTLLYTLLLCLGLFLYELQNVYMIILTVGCNILITVLYLPFLDRRLFWLLFRSFEIYYITMNVFLLSFILFVHMNYGPVWYNVLYMIQVTVLGILLISLDAAIFFGTKIKFATLVCGLTFFSSILLCQWVEQLLYGASGARFSKGDIQLGILVIETKSAALVCLMQLIFYCFKYFYKTLLFIYKRGKIQANLDIVYKNVHRFVYYNIKLLLFSSDEENNATGKTDQIIKSYISTANSVLYNGTQPETVLIESFLFHPIIKAKWIRQVANHKIYMYTMPVYIIIGLFLLTNTISLGTFGAYLRIVLTVGMFLIFLCELSRFDKNLFFELFRNFEFWITILSVLQHTIYGLISQWELYGKIENITSFIWFFMFYCIATAMDAAPTYNKRLKGAILGIMVLNNIRILFTNIFWKSTYSRTFVCYYFFCSDSRLIALNAIFNLAIFQSKFLFSILRRNGRCLILALPIAYEFYQQ